MRYFTAIFIWMSLCCSYSYGAAYAENTYVQSSSQRIPEAYWPIYDAFDQLFQNLQTRKEGAYIRNEILRNSAESSLEKQKVIERNLISVKDSDLFFGKVEKSLNSLLNVKRLSKSDSNIFVPMNLFFRSLVDIRMQELNNIFCSFIKEDGLAPTNPFLFEKISASKESPWKTKYNLSLQEEETHNYQLFHLLIVAVHDQLKGNLDSETVSLMQRTPCLKGFLEAPDTIGGYDEVAGFGLLMPFYEIRLNLILEDPSVVVRFKAVKWSREKFGVLLTGLRNKESTLEWKNNSLKEFYGLAPQDFMQQVYNVSPKTLSKNRTKIEESKTRLASKALGNLWSKNDLMIHFLKEWGLQLNGETYTLEEFKKPKKKKKKGAAEAGPVEEDVDLGPSLFAQPVEPESKVKAPEKEDNPVAVVVVEEEEAPAAAVPAVRFPEEKNIGEPTLVGVRELANFILKNRGSFSPLKVLREREQRALDDLFDYEKKISWEEAQKVWSSLGGTFTLNHGTSHGRYKHAYFGPLSGHGSQPHGGRDTLSPGALVQLRSYILVLGYKPSDWTGEIDLEAYVMDRTHKR